MLKQLLQSNTLRTELSFKLFYNLSIVYFKILPAKPLGCSLFSFVQVWVTPTSKQRDMHSLDAHEA